MALFTKVLSTRTLISIACVLGGVLLMKSMGVYYGFNWADAFPPGSVGFQITDGGKVAWQAEIVLTPVSLERLSQRFSL
jgi:hypothetical protein